MISDPFMSIFGAFRGANHSYWCELQKPSRCVLSARIGVPTYRLRSTARFFDEIDTGGPAEAARAVLEGEWQIMNPHDDEVLKVALAFMTSQRLQHKEIDALLTEEGSP
jgi:hypothetical protein